MSTEWIKPNGTVLEINDNAVAYAKSLGWKRVKASKKVIEFDARGLPWDERLHQKNRKQDDGGSWKYKRGMTAEDAAEIEAELMG